ncbi:methionine/alanine import family NSS transporter small subunit [Cellulomonas bogoriensis]|nr:methionine/alanine import family NSS transporter small subunit [Cellulomonas bogoriensis]
MTGTALTFLILSVVLVWGGLAVSIWRLRRDARQEVPEPGETSGGSPHS